MGSEDREEIPAQQPRPPIRKGLFDSLLLLLGVFLLWESAGYARMARAFPRLVLLLMVAMILVDMAWGVVKAHRRTRGAPGAARAGVEDPEPGGSEEVPERAPRTRVFLCVLLLFAFPACLVLLGFLPGSVAFFLGAAWTLGYRDLKGLLVSCAAMAGLLYVVFVLIMESRLPVGLVVRWVSR